MSELEQRMSEHEPVAGDVAVREVQWSPDEIEQKLHLLHARLRQDSLRVRASRRYLPLGYAAALCAAAGALLFFFVLRENESGKSKASPADASSVSNSVALPGEFAAAPLLKHDQTFQGKGLVRFADGSQAELMSNEAQLLVQEVSPSTVAVELLRGESSFRVTPRPARQFRVFASGVEVAVIGTEFSVSHEPGRVRVGVVHGKVRVKSGEQERILIGGEAAWFEASQPSAENVASAQPSNNDASGTEPSAQAVALAKSPPQGSASESALPADLRQRFIHLHQTADYEKAYLMLDQQREILASSDQDLMRAADVARYSGHPAEALGYLKKVKPSGPQGLTAAFTRGRLLLHELNRPAEAASAFAEVQRLAPAGPLAEDALFREIESRSRAGQPAEVARLAQVFVARYPQSRRRDAVKQLVKP